MILTLGEICRIMNAAEVRDLIARFLAVITGTFVLTLLGCSFLPLKGIIAFAVIFAILGIAAIFVKVSFRQTLAAVLLTISIASGIFSVDLYHLQSTQNRLLNGEHRVAGEIVDRSTNNAGNLACYRLALQSVDGDPIRFFHRYAVNIYSENNDLNVGDLVDSDILFFDEPIRYGMGKEERILCSGYVETLKGEASDAFSLRRFLYSIKMNLRNRIKTGGKDTIGLLKSVCFGDRSTLDPALAVSLRRIGLSHIISVSGFHLSFAVLLFNYLMILLGIGHRKRYIFDIFICIFFTVAVGMPLSCVRACVMIVFYSVAMALDLFSDSLTSLGVAAFLIVLFNPQSIRDVGFLLSVSATLGMILLQSRIERFLFPPKISSSHRVNDLYRQFTGIFSCSVAASLATLPVTASVFQTVSVIGPFANILLLFPLELMFMLGMVSALLGWVPFLGDILAFLSDVLYNAIEWSANLLGMIPFASRSHFDFADLLWIILLVLLLAASAYFFVKHQKRCFWQLSAMLVCFVVLFNLIHLYKREPDLVEIAFVDVGQGDCTVISRGQEAVILDYGGSSQKRYHLIEYLRKKDIFNIELLAFTHLHADHTNGLNTLEKNCYIQKTVYPDLEADSEQLPVQLKRMNATVLSEDQTFSVLNGVSVTAITDALKDAAAGGNENCICYRVEYGDVSLLVTGDLMMSDEIKMLERLEDVTLLKVSHHGSKGSSAYPFLKAVSPEIAVISVGDNSYGLPSEQTLERLNTVVPSLYITQKDGTVLFKTDGRLLERIIYDP